MRGVADVLLPGANHPKLPKKNGARPWLPQPIATIFPRNDFRREEFPAVISLVAAPYAVTHPLTRAEVAEFITVLPSNARRDRDELRAGRDLHVAMT